jgi:hypothetical protein
MAYMIARGEQMIAEMKQGLVEEAKHGLYYNVNKRKKAGTSRPASSPKAPTAQAWKDAAKTAKKEDAAEAEKNPHTSALGKALYRDLSKEKKASPQQVQRNKERWAQRQAEREQGVTEMDKSQTPPGRDGNQQSPRDDRQSSGRDTGPRSGPDRVAKPVSKQKATRDMGAMFNQAFTDSHKKKGAAEAVDIGQEWMSDTELDQYVPDRLQQQWRELLGYDRNGNPSALWANLTGGYEPDVNDPQHRRLMVKVANKWFTAKKIPNVKFFDVKDADDELEWLVQIGEQGMAEATGDERFDTIMGRMQKEPTIPDSQMPPTDVKDLHHWAVKHHKPYHKIFAKWANREGYKSVAPALQKAGNLDSDALDYWTPDVWKLWFGPGAEMPHHWSKERVPDELRDYLETVFDAYENIWQDWPTEYRQIGDRGVNEGWSQKYKSSINCSHPKGFSQKAHCTGKKKHNESHEVMEMICPDCGMCETHSNMTINEIAKGAKDSNGVTKCWPGKHAAGTKKGKNGGQVRNCVPNESMLPASAFTGSDKNKINGKGMLRKGPAKPGKLVGGG